MRLSETIAGELSFESYKSPRFIRKRREDGSTAWVDVWDNDKGEFVYEDDKSVILDITWGDLDTYEIADKVVDLMNRDYSNYMSEVFKYARVKIKLS